MVFIFNKSQKTCYYTSGESLEIVMIMMDFTPLHFIPFTLKGPDNFTSVTDYCVIRSHCIIHSGFQYPFYIPYSQVIMLMMIGDLIDKKDISSSAPVFTIFVR